MLCRCRGVWSAHSSRAEYIISTTCMCLTLTAYKFISELFLSLMFVYTPIVFSWHADSLILSSITDTCGGHFVTLCRLFQGPHDMHIAQLVFWFQCSFFVLSSIADTCGCHFLFYVVFSRGHMTWILHNSFGINVLTFCLLAHVAGTCGGHFVTLCPLFQGPLDLHISFGINVLTFYCLLYSWHVWLPFCSFMSSFLGAMWPAWLSTVVISSQASILRIYSTWYSGTGYVLKGLCCEIFKPYFFGLKDSTALHEAFQEIFSFSEDTAFDCYVNTKFACWLRGHLW